MIPQLPSRNRTPRRREHTGGSTSSTFLASESSFGTGPSSRPRSQVERKETVTYQYEWRIEDVTQLAAHVEGSGQGEEGQEQEHESPSEFLRMGRKTADEMYKFDLGVTTDEGAETNSRHLSLYICSLLRARDTYLYPPVIANIFVGITGTPKSGREYGYTEYLWTHTERFNFQPHDDFIKVRLPILSTISQHHSVAPTDAFTLCIKIEQEYGETPTFQKEKHVTVPTDMIDALAALIDVPNGADVKFICLEHEIDSLEEEGGGEEKMRSRKRVIYANSQILSSRSQYFQDLFATNFVETTQVASDRFKTVVVESADFSTVYWMLRFLYTNELLFDEKQDQIRNLVTQQTIESSAIRSMLVHHSSSQFQKDEWDWRYLSQDYEEPLSATTSTDHDTRSVTSNISGSTKSTKPSISITTPSSARSTSTSRQRRVETAPISPTRESTIHSRASSGSYTTPTSTSSTRTAGKGAYPRTTSNDTDPHCHPAGHQSPACAMAVYMLAHQYRIEALADLAKKHILSHLTHSSCIPVLYTDLHEQVLQYIHTEWKQVKGDGEFVRCFQEVARGEWGEEGGTLLADMVSRLPY